MPDSDCEGPGLDQPLDASMMAVASGEENTCKTKVGEGQGIMWWEMSSFLSFLKGTSRLVAILCPGDMQAGGGVDKADGNWKDTHW